MRYMPSVEDRLLLKHFVIVKMAVKVQKGSQSVVVSYEVSVSESRTRHV